MFKLRLEGFREFRRALLGLASSFTKAAEELLFAAASDIRAEMSEEGLPVTYPIQWDSPKQRRAFFATDGFGKGIPYRRTGIAVSSWGAIRIEGGAQVSNPLSHIRYLSGTADGSPVGAGGKMQSNIHKGRWKLFYPVWTGIVNTLPKRVRDRLKVIAENQGFGTQ